MDVKKPCDRELEKVTREKFIENQLKYCEENAAPLFIPISGRCYRCRGDIITELIKRGDDGMALVTGCPICLHSFCE